MGITSINGIPIEQFIRTPEMDVPSQDGDSETVSDSNAVTLPEGEIGAPAV